MAARIVGVIGSGLTCALFASLCGCGDADLAELRVPAEQNHVIAASAPAAAPLSLPEDRPFAIHTKQSSQNPGAAGQAESQADATPAGAALCTAQAANGGSATANFVIGQRIDNRSPHAQKATIEVEFDVADELAADKTPAPQTVASAELTLVVLDGKRRSLARMPILQSTSDTAAGAVRSHDQRRIAVSFDPDQSYDVVLHGKVEASSSTDQSSQARIELKQLRMRLSFSPSAATLPADH